MIPENFFSDTGKEIFTETVAYFSEVFTLFPKVARFVYLVLKGLFIAFLSIMFGPFLLGAYMWGERKLGETMNLKEKILFWFITAPLSIVHILSAMYCLLLLGIN